MLKILKKLEDFGLLKNYKQFCKEKNKSENILEFVFIICK